jgi:hypothetical protein
MTQKVTVLPQFLHPRIYDVPLPWEWGYGQPMPRDTASLQTCRVTDCTNSRNRHLPRTLVESRIGYDAQRSMRVPKLRFSEVPDVQNANVQRGI